MFDRTNILCPFLQNKIVPTCRFSPHYATSMPYELKALEVALATMTAILEAEVFRLEHRGYPIVDKLTSDVRRAER